MTEGERRVIFLESGFPRYRPAARVKLRFMRVTAALVLAMAAMLPCFTQARAEPAIDWDASSSRFEPAREPLFAGSNGLILPSLAAARARKQEAPCAMIDELRGVFSAEGTPRQVALIEKAMCRLGASPTALQRFQRLRRTDRTFKVAMVKDYSETFSGQYKSSEARIELNPVGIPKDQMIDRLAIIFAHEALGHALLESEGIQAGLSRDVIPFWDKDEPIAFVVQWVVSSELGIPLLDDFQNYSNNPHRYWRSLQVRVPAYVGKMSASSLQHPDVELRLRRERLREFMDEMHERAEWWLFLNGAVDHFVKVHRPDAKSFRWIFAHTANAAAQVAWNQRQEPAAWAKLDEVDRVLADHPDDVAQIAEQLRHPYFISARREFVQLQRKLLGGLERGDLRFETEEAPEDQVSLEQLVELIKWDIQANPDHLVHRQGSKI